METKNQTAFEDLTKKLEEAIEERDEARIKVCELESLLYTNSDKTIRKYAKERGWSYLYDTTTIDKPCHFRDQSYNDKCIEGIDSIGNCTHLEKGGTWENCEHGRVYKDEENKK